VYSARCWRSPCATAQRRVFKVGLIAIIGLSSKNAIMIIEFARKLQDEGMS
jgi:Cation/multidrug efflux pump